MSDDRQRSTPHALNEYERCSTCRRAEEIIHRFLTSGDYWELAAAFDSLRTQDPEGTDHLDRWQADAALLAEEWEAAWEFRTLGLLEPGRRITFTDVINVRSRCADRSLSAADLHLVVLSDTGLTPWGDEHLRQVNAVVDELLKDLSRRENTNPLQALYERYAGREPTEDDFAEIADECDYLISSEQLRRRREGEAHAIERYREGAEAGGDMAHVDQQMYEWYTAPRLWCFQPTQGRFVECVVVESAKDGTVERRDHPRFGFTRPPQWLDAAVEPLCRALFRRCENDARRRAGLPEIGEGWVSETELYRLISEAFDETPVLQHARPSWLKPQHLDIYLPAHNVAVEYQGRQHFEPIDFFGGEEGLDQRRERDARKRRLCRKHDCTLIEVRAGYDAAEIVAQVLEAVDGGG